MYSVDVISIPLPLVLDLVFDPQENDIVPIWYWYHSAYRYWYCYYWLLLFSSDPFCEGPERKGRTVTDFITLKENCVLPFICWSDYEPVFLSNDGHDYSVSYYYSYCDYWDPGRTDYYWWRDYYCPNTNVIGWPNDIIQPTVLLCVWMAYYSTFFEDTIHVTINTTDQW